MQRPQVFARTSRDIGPGHPRAVSWYRVLRASFGHSCRSASLSGGFPLGALAICSGFRITPPRTTR